jgi:glyoxylase-like metal-dependent hydrolase (beta-lactamase superfamily II)
MVDYRIISIGTLAANPLWGEEHVEVRTGHATTTLVTTDDAVILVDPSLPPAVILARLGERAPLRADQITHVFMTAAGLEHRRGLAAFDHARWLVYEPELEAARTDAQTRRDAADEGDGELLGAIDHDVEVLGRCRPAPDRLARGVDLFPLPGVTAGACGLLLSQPRATVLICGDAIPTIEHLERGKVLPWCADLEQARESFAEAVQIADVLVPGRDNVVFNPLREGQASATPTEF